MSTNIVQIDNLVKRYGDLVALDHLNLSISEGEIFGLLGPNGSGKTTAINCMLSLLKYYEAQQRHEGAADPSGASGTVPALYRG